MFTTRSSLLSAEAVLLIILGVAALILPVVAALTITLVLGIILVLSGILGLVAALWSGPRHPRGWSLLSAAIALLVGIILLVNPFAGTLALVILLGLYLLIDGVALIGMALSHRRRMTSRWTWILATGILDLVLALVLIFMNGAGSAIVVGFVIGIDLIAAGVALLMFQRGVSGPIPSSSALL